MMRPVSYVQYGAGFSAPDGWLNFDSSPTLRIERIPVVGSLLGRAAGNASPFPKNVIYGDIVKGLPVKLQSVCGLYASHVLEHLSREDMRTALRNSLAVLEQGGIFRLIVPDLAARARAYLSGVDADDETAAHRFMSDSYLGVEARPRGFVGRLREQFGNSTHLWMWDQPSMMKELSDAGFGDVRQARLGDSGDPMFDRVENIDRFIDDGVEEVAIQARRA